MDVDCTSKTMQPRPRAKTQSPCGFQIVVASCTHGKGYSHCNGRAKLILESSVVTGTATWVIQLVAVLARHSVAAIPSSTMSEALELQR
jgi:hypothetical protein